MLPPGSLLALYPQLFELTVGFFVSYFGFTGLVLWNIFCISNPGSMSVPYVPYKFKAHLLALYAQPCVLPYVRAIQGVQCVPTRLCAVLLPLQFALV